MLIKILISAFVSLITIASSKNTRILGGSDTEIVDFPYMAALIRLPDNKFECGGAIISNTRILTAAHCVYNFVNKADELKIIVGATNISSDSGISYRLKKIVINPYFQRAVNDVSCNLYDIAVLKVDGTITFSRFVNKVNLPDKELINGDVGMISGWGATFYPSIVTSDTLKKAWMKIYTANFCNSKRLVKNVIQSDQLCGFQKKGVGPCLGDSGSPLVTINTIIGIASTCIPCAIGIPDVYTKVLYHMEFIRFNM